MTDELKVQIQRLAGHDDLPLPKYMTEHAAGMDIFAALTEEIVILPGERRLIPSGIVMAIPEGYEGEVRPRSGLAVKHGVTLMNAPGTIDADYRGEIGIIMINHGKEPFIVRRGDRIAQILVRPVCKVTWDERSNLDMTARGAGGFGHTK
ncbi:MAG: dUTP diphosphatase [Deltaproteobacteria bacterium]|nr:dUTP diphosphatase [Deltaproteobacteria bacterium]